MPNAVATDSYAEVNGKRLRVIRQVVSTETGAVSSAGSIIPLDDSIPQNTEGTQYMSLSITPQSATSRLRIDVVLFATVNAPEWVNVGLFQDSTADAIASLANYQQIGGGGAPVVFTHHMVAGTTSATTFKVRAGTSSSGVLTFNGIGGGRIFGGTMASSITITEYAA